LPLRLYQHHLLQHHDEEGVVHPLDHGIVEVTCIELTLVRRWLESHELSIMIVTIFVLSLWWIFCLWDDFMRCKEVFVSDVWVYVYVTPFMCACSDQTSMPGLVRGICA
jgi:hypothetical protein